MSSNNSRLQALADHFAEYGLTIEQLQDPSLLGRRPETLIANIEGVYGHFQADGLMLKDYLQAATRYPQLFYQRPETLIEHVNIIKGLYKRGAVTFSKNAYNSARLPIEGRSSLSSRRYIIDTSAAGCHFEC
jgi:hypothetical protein